MSYEKQNFVDGQTLTAAQLNHMEDGIAAAATGVKGDPGEGFTANAKALLLNLFENAAYKTNTMQPTLNALRAEWGGSAQEVPVQSVSLSAVTMTLNESESQTLTATVLPANATDRAVVWSVLPTGFATVANGVVTGIKAGNCTVTATAGGKSASCAVTVEVVETAQLIYSLPGETVLTQGLDTGLKLLEHASTETPQYTILVDAKAGDDFNANTWPAFLHCLTETGDTGNLPGFNSTSSPLNKKTEFAYYNYGGVTLSDSIEHFKTRTRYAVQIDGRKYRGGTRGCISTVVTNSTALAKADYILLEGGVNDAWNNAPVGTLTDGFAAAYDETTMTGALEKMLDDLATNHSDKRVAYVFPHGGMFAGSENWYKTYKPAILAALKKWGVPYVDIAETTPPMGKHGVSELGDKYTSDGTHPNAAGYERFYAEPIAALLKRL